MKRCDPSLMTHCQAGGRTRPSLLRYVLAVVSALLVVVLVTPAPQAQTTPGPEVTGQWSEPFTLPVVGVHMMLLRSGQVLIWDRTAGDAGLWNPALGVYTTVPNPFTDIFCAGQVTLGDGRPLVVGGNQGGFVGLQDANVFDPITETWDTVASMAYPRWYPTATTLPDGRVLVVSGTTTCPTCFADTPEVYDPSSNTWTQLSDAPLTMPLYPFMFVLPDGRVLYAGSDEANTSTYVLDVAQQTWTLLDPAVVDGGSAVMYRPGVVMKAGAPGDVDIAPYGAVPEAYVLDTTRSGPTWRQVGSMAFARAYHTLTLLPDGNVIVTSGTENSDPVAAPGVLAAEIWNARTEAWSTMASMQARRAYHSTALLLPDARVLVAGSGRFSDMIDEFTAEIFSPPYLFRGPRPTITAAPSTVDLSSQFFVETPDGGAIDSVALVRLGAVTHGIDQDQRYVPLGFSPAGAGLNIQAPASGAIAPPGYYMLFLVNRAGVPSVAEFVRIAMPAVNEPTKAVLTSPQPGSTLSGAAVTFSWSAGTGALQYWLTIGTTEVGSNNVYDGSQATNLAGTVSGLPTNGSTVYVRLGTLLGASWQFNDYTYTAALPIASPAPGTTLAGPTVTFSWGAAAGATQYWLTIGTTGVGSNDVFDGSSGASLAATVSGLPTNGSTVYVRLRWQLGSSWQFNDYTYTAARIGGSGFSLRFHGNGINAVGLDRVRIRIDDPPGPPADVGATDFTLEFWMKALASENTAGAQLCGENHNWIFGNIVFDRDRFSQDRKYGLSIANGRFVFGVTGGGTGERTICGVTDVLDNVWHHVAVQQRRSDGRMWLFVDGRLDAEAAGPSGDISYPDNAVPGNFCGPGGSGQGSLPCTNDPFLVIGAEKHDAGAEFPSYSGFIDEVRLSNVLRYPTNDNFAPPIQPFAPDANTAALYHFDEGQGNIITDSSGAAGGPSTGVRNFGGSPAGPEWVTDTPFGNPPPAPSLRSLTPNSVAAGTAGFLLTASGSDFVSSSVIQWNGANRPTTFVSGTQLQTTISARDIAAAGAAQVTVVSPPPGGGATNALTFTIVPSLAVSVGRAGTGSGTVTSAPAGINCGSTCSARFATDIIVVLTASPDSNSTFDGWTGCDAVDGAQCITAVSATRVVTAAFQVIPLRLTVTKGGTGSGLVASPAGISCGGVCSRVLNSGTALQLTATPDPGSAFAGWSGGGCSGTGLCSVTLTTATTVTATFTAPLGQFALSVTRRGSASGTVTSAPPGIDCGATCAQLYPSGAIVILTANASVGAVFRGWSGGGCSGSGSCVVAMTAMQSVRAIFSAALTSPNPTPAVSVIQAADITDLRSVINTLRAQNFGLGGLTFTDPAIVIGSTVVKAVHILELRGALNDAYVQAGIAPPSYSASTLTAGGTVIRAADLNELRSAVLTLE